MLPEAVAQLSIQRNREAASGTMTEPTIESRRGPVLISHSPRARARALYRFFQLGMGYSCSQCRGEFPRSA